MKPHPRIRKTVKWGGAVVSVACAGLWAMSGIIGVVFQVRGLSVIALQGQGIIQQRDPPNVVQGVSFGFPRLGAYSFVESRIDFDTFPGGWAVNVPLWVLAAALLFVSAIAWRLDALARRRARIGLCPKCSYNRAGLPPGAVCPECGAAASVPPTAVS